MKSAPRILILPSSNAASSAIPVGDAAALEFSALATTGRLEPTAARDLAAQASAFGLLLLRALPPDEPMGHLIRDLDAGIRGFLISATRHVPVERWRELIAAARDRDPDCLFIADLLGAPATAALTLRGAGFDFLLNSVRWWDGAAPWFLDQQAMTRPIAGSVGFPELPGAAACCSPGVCPPD